MEKVTTDLILQTIKGWVENRQVIEPNLWLDSVSKLNALISDEHAKLFELQQQVAQLKVASIENGDSVAKAKVKAEASEIYKLMCIQKAKIEQIEEHIRIGKLQARMAQNEWQGN